MSGVCICVIRGGRQRLVNEDLCLKALKKPPFITLLVVFVEQVCIWSQKQTAVMETVCTLFRPVLPVSRSSSASSIPTQPMIWWWMTKRRGDGGTSVWATLQCRMCPDDNSKEKHNEERSSGFSLKPQRLGESDMASEGRLETQKYKQFIKHHKWTHQHMSFPLVLKLQNRQITSFYSTTFKVKLKLKSNQIVYFWNNWSYNFTKVPVFWLFYQNLIF